MIVSIVSYELQGIFIDTPVCVLTVISISEKFFDVVAKGTQATPSRGPMKKRTSVVQGGGKRLPNYHLVGENCILVGENLFDLPDLVGENVCLRKICLLGGSLEREGLTNHDCNQVLFKAFTMTKFQNFLQLWWILKKFNHKLVSLLAINTTYKVIAVEESGDPP